MKIKWIDGLYNPKTYLRNNTFKFINIEHSFENKINWNLSTYKKLWLYNLNYFDFLNQEALSKEEGVKLIHEFIDTYPSVIDGKESYPTALRLINWIKFISRHQIEDPCIFGVIQADAQRLCNNLEYHLLGNHLLENAFALWFSAHLFNNSRYFKIAKHLLKKELEEQILTDGGHFELSPMYHQLMLYRVLDCIHLSKLNPNKFAIDLYPLLIQKASQMLSWLENITYTNGEIPLVNDSVNKISPDSNSLFSYCEKLQISSAHMKLSASGYRMVKASNFELLMDVGQIGASYQPGHAHADTFNFELYINNTPVFVDTGISTYNVGDIRAKERSTEAHNSVVVNNISSSVVWSGFRVAKRAKVTIENELEQSIQASHDGYLNLGVLHKRAWAWNPHKISIIDDLSGTPKNAKAYFHFHPEVNFKATDNGFKINNKHSICFENAISINTKIFEFAPEFNKRINSTCIEVIFNKQLKTSILIE
ncbi:alginate lyase family protein [Formosa sp. Hel1_33_131]|uniref:alginate lyase family protein n=1 Tax=Formosa sp. Hel1_33_131 TaxID=1336794 RepID=UPI000B0E2B6B|nr:alginate lyase family protein [Formosa sp. Hel1_33_131]